MQCAINFRSVGESQFYNAGAWRGWALHSRHADEKHSTRLQEGNHILLTYYTVATPILMKNVSHGCHLCEKV